MSLTGKPDLTTAAPIANDGFWPDLLLADLLNKYRIPAEYADDVIITGLTIAMIRVNEQLQAVKSQLLLELYSSLADFSAANPNTINAVDLLLTEYQNAVFCRAKAGLLQQFNTLNRKENAENAAKESDETEQYWLDESQASIKTFFSIVLPGEVVSGRANTRVTLL